MYLQNIKSAGTISQEDFQANFYKPGIPLVIRDLSKTWPAFTKWNWEYMNKLLGEKRVGIYNNTKSAPDTPVNKADAYVTIGEYIRMIADGPVEWRIFLFNFFNHAPQLTKDFSWPDELMDGFVKRVPMLFMGGAGSITHMHFDMDLSHILHTQFIGRKRVLLFPYSEQDKLYRKPFEVMSFPDFSYYHDEEKSKLDFKKYPALSHAKGYEVILEHGDTLYMPAGFWHHMEYVESGFAMSLRALQSSLPGKLHGAWNLTGMRTMDTLMKKTIPSHWHRWKEKQAFANAEKCLAREAEIENQNDILSEYDLFWKK